MRNVASAKPAFEDRVVDAIAVLLLGEIAFRGRGRSPDLVAGLGLVLALRAALRRTRAPIRLVLLGLAGIAHVNGWRGTRNGSMS